MAEVRWPSLSREKDGHRLEILPAVDEADDLVGIIFWCKSCDADGNQIVKVRTTDEEAMEAYGMLKDIAEWHTEL